MTFFSHETNENQLFNLATGETVPAPKSTFERQPQDEDFILGDARSLVGTNVGGLPSTAVGTRNDGVQGSVSGAIASSRSKKTNTSNDDIPMPNPSTLVGQQPPPSPFLRGNSAADQPPAPLPSSLLDHRDSLTPRESSGHSTNPMYHDVHNLQTPGTSPAAQGGLALIDNRVSHCAKLFAKMLEVCRIDRLL